MKKVLIPTKLNAVARETLNAHGGYEVVQDDSQELSTLASQHPDTYALFVRSEKVTPEIIDAMPMLKVVIRAGAGYNTIDTKYARSKGIDVMNTPGANANAVAEEVIALMLADARHIVLADASTRVGKWEKKNFMGKEITGKTVGIVGFGAIGQLVAKRLFGFDAKVLAYDPFLSDERARDLGAVPAELGEIFEQCDYISLHMPENDDTRGVINKSLFARMKNGATLINCARAGIINEDDLRELKADKGLRFLNDVYAKDAEGDKSVSDIADIMLPHLGASTNEANFNAAQRSATQLIGYDDKGIASYVVNRDVPEGLDRAYSELAFALAHTCRGIAGGNKQMKLIETSFYGDLAKFSGWLLVQIVAALSDDFDRTQGYDAALEYLKEMGVEYFNRETDTSKGYGDSITVDVTTSVDAATFKRISVRGTVAEGNMMISRINDFDKLYFEPVGTAVLFIYQDRPGVVGRIGNALAEAGININDMRNPHDPSGKNSLALLRISGKVDCEVVEKIAEQIEALHASCVSY
ncbi:NAD(P)-dependent oxidoreductase [Pontiella sulfatireligans]|uniref:D-3-phosphoglycerate dehydrogenase n=1 Tax=Pontiella sulfatireligans TaxID=2750658 RepID=A0A6C2UIV9_9BACT|nr:NAD(P)-dependent oxidoreductase [Pontiella sulfatireligans]VGO20048.1 D-3-phosphoglycerate dehydrogenase [Pontiella sulfatireligans]